MIEELSILGEKAVFASASHYSIPRYQRAYAWEDKEIIQLIDDINGIGLDDRYYIGSLVVSRIKGKADSFEVVDGQQRLTTLFILLQYLSSRGTMDKVERKLSFDCREKSNYTLERIQNVLNGDRNIDADKIEKSIVNGIDIIKQKFETEGLNAGEFVSRLKNVILYRIEVPVHTDLNRYFEIMNTRGEQLEQHDILKARLMEKIKQREDRRIFSRIWEACSDMTGYVQMHFTPQERECIFGDDWIQCPSGEWSKYDVCSYNDDAQMKDADIRQIISGNFKVADIDAADDSDVHVRFDSIIDFPYFLLHSLRAFVKQKGVELDESLGYLLDDKKLIKDFESVESGRVKGVPLQDFPKKFILHLLKSRYLFDKYIVKREYSGEDNIGEWSLKELSMSGSRGSKKAYYSNSKIRSRGEWETTYTPRNKECLMIQSALRVSYTSPKVMHWITELLEWLTGKENCGKNDFSELVTECEKIAAKATKGNFLDSNDYKQGVSTPHLVFNFLDYLLWKGNKSKYGDFAFEFRNSVEHWYPQHPSEGSIKPWQNKDTFGNLCIISRSVNSKFSNLSPKSKMETYKGMVEKGSLKLRIMGEIISGISNEEWTQIECRKHEDEMLNILKETCKSFETSVD